MYCCIVHQMLSNLWKFQESMDRILCFTESLLRIRCQAFSFRLGCATRDRERRQGDRVPTCDGRRRLRANGQRDGPPTSLTLLFTACVLFGKEERCSCSQPGRPRDERSKGRITVQRAVHPFSEPADYRPGTSYSSTPGALFPRALVSLFWMYCMLFYGASYEPGTALTPRWTPFA